MNRSAYCTHAHKQISAKMGFTSAEIAEMSDPRHRGDREDERARSGLCGRRLTLRPGDIADDTFEALGRHFSESQIVEITMVAALYNMINRFQRGPSSWTWRRTDRRSVWPGSVRLTRWASITDDRRMDAASLREIQRPIKDAYRDDRSRALVTLRAHGGRRRRSDVLG